MGVRNKLQYRLKKVTIIPISLVIICLQPSGLTAQERDPFISIVDLETQKFAEKRIDLGSIVLKGIIFSEPKAVAILNDELVMAGDQWRGFTVEAIGKDSITLKDNIRSYQFFIEDSPVTKESQEAVIPEAASQETPLPLGLPETDFVPEREKIFGDE